MSFSNLLSYSFRSYVHTTHGQKTAELPLSEKGGGTISLKRLIEENVPQLKNNTWFWQSPLLGNGHLQTVYAAVGNFENVDQIYYGRRLITWEDGSTVSADYVVDPPKSTAEWDESLKYCPISDPPPYPVRTRYLTPEEILKLHTPLNEDKPLVIALHGLSGGSHESYVRAVISQLISDKYGFECMVLNSRGCARTKITTPQLFCALMTDDIRRLVKSIRKEQPKRRIYLMGFSLGAAILANYLGQEGDETEIDAAVPVACPWDLAHCFYGLEYNYLGKNVYSHQMANNLLRLIKNHRQTLADHPVFVEGQKQKIKFINDFDEVYTAPFFGFDTAFDYYRNASPVHRLTKIRTPTLILNALDDPIVDYRCVPYPEVRANPYTFLATTDLGGHLGWFNPGSGRWFPQVIADFFKAFEDRIVHDHSAIKAEIKPRKRLFDGDRLVFN
ncbi:hypothetical protein TRICI_005502 [Trichomonascus ciferrii]|uniref:AB hydrolase-1 domain-containing protein n=1 Tax=Trichomonascus ciferrii TaxID=44093 RepID=A0A642USH1_9ASCO|nr:hypothetical protein TRICI_005502 [Trichomonascus ciferrii]